MCFVKIKRFMTKDKLKKGLVGLGIASVIAGGIAYYFFQEKDYLTWEEYQETIRAYQVKIEDIKKDCDNDFRCIEVDKEKRVIFGAIKNKKEIMNKLNEWIEKDEEDPKHYKKKKREIKKIGY